MYQITQCIHCKSEFRARKADLKRGHAKFCTRQCFGLHRKATTKAKDPNVGCALCSKPFYMNDTKKKNSKSGLFFCCRAHKDQAQRIGGLKAIQPSHYGTGEINYRALAFKSFKHECNRCSFSAHPVLEVHHRDRDRTNNDLSNLEILCPTCHHVDHFLAGDGRWSKAS